MSYGAMVGFALILAEEAEKERERFKALCDSLPKEEANKLIEKREIERKEEKQHQRNLEVAREGRSIIKTSIF